VQIYYRLHYTYQCTHTAHSKLAVDHCAMCSQGSTIVDVKRCENGPIDLYTVGGWRWIYTCLSFQEILLYCTHYYCEFTLKHTCIWEPAWEADSEHAWEPAGVPDLEPAWESHTSWAVEQSMGDFLPHEHSDCVECFANRWLSVS